MEIIREVANSEGTYLIDDLPMWEILREKHPSIHQSLIQDEIHELLKKHEFGSLVGHKIGCTTQVMQDYLGIEHPCSGEIFDSMVFFDTMYTMLTLRSVNINTCLR